MSALPVTVADPGCLQVLVVEDDDDLAALLEGIFAQNPDYASSTQRVASLDRAVEVVQRRSPSDLDAVVLDLGLPDSQGLRTARAVLDAVRAPTAVVVFTTMRDQSMAAKTLELGVQDYVVKEDLTPQLVTRVVRYGVTRARLVDELEVARQGEKRERELRRLERLATDPTTTQVSAAMLGAQSLADRLGTARYHDELVTEYRRLLRRGLDEQVYRGQATVEGDVRSLAAILGFLGAGPRDVIELHTRTLRRLLRAADGVESEAAVEEGRVLVLRLMGRLVAYYRDRSVGSRPGRAPATGSTAESTREGGS